MKNKILILILLSTTQLLGQINAKHIVNDYLYVNPGKPAPELFQKDFYPVFLPLFKEHLHQKEKVRGINKHLMVDWSYDEFNLFQGENWK